MKLRLSDRDRELHGGPEWLEWDENVLTTSEAEKLQELLGVDPFKYHEWMPTAGVPAIRWAAWLALRRAGVEADWAAFDPDILGMRTVRPEPPKVVPEGKAPRRSTRPRPSAASGKS